MITIRVPCRLCDRWFTVPSTRWLTRPRPCCNDCDEQDDPIRTDEDGFGGAWLEPPGERS